MSRPEVFPRQQRPPPPSPPRRYISRTFTLRHHHSHSCTNMACKLLLVLAALVALSTASYVPQDSYGAVSTPACLILALTTISSWANTCPQHPLLLLPQAPANYDFNWAVNDAASSNNYGHQEARNGDNTQGYYFVQLPDGRLQKVTYSVQGNSGFLAEVTYEGEAQYPQQGYGVPTRPPTPTYGTPGPSYAR
ncbi:hypothetical protein O3P69_014708 [Scylla paramamosain]|uniref:Cuticle protein n=1 Tax=Scylla paramamosain TaxID=85552 RepID=A0AAW0TZB1_SCYPA